MINLGYGSDISFRRISPDLVQMTLRLQANMDRGMNNPYYHGATTEVSVLLNQELFTQMQGEMNGLDNVLPFEPRTDDAPGHLTPGTTE